MRKVLLDVELAERVAEEAVDHADAALPALARQRLAGERRRRRSRSARRRRRCSGRAPPRSRSARPATPASVGSGTVGTIAANALKNDGCARITAGDRSMPCGCAHAAQSKPGISAGELPEREPRVGRRQVAALGFRPLDARQRGLEREHRRAPRPAGAAVRPARRCASGTATYLRADAGERRIVLQVVVAVGQEDAALRDADDGRAGIQRVDADRSAERAAGGDRRQVAGFGRDIARRRGSRRCAAAAAGSPTRPAARCAPRRRCWRRGRRSAAPADPRGRLRPRGDLLDDRAQIALGLVGDLGERAVGDAIVRDRRPRAASRR